MSLILNVEEIDALGFEWPKYPTIEAYAVEENGRVDLSATLEKMRVEHAYYRKMVNDAFNFKMSTGADYSDFSNDFDDHARNERLLRQAIAYLEQIITAAS